MSSLVRYELFSINVVYMVVSKFLKFILQKSDISVCECFLTTNKFSKKTGYKIFYLTFSKRKQEFFLYRNQILIKVQFSIKRR